MVEIKSPYSVFDYEKGYISEVTYEIEIEYETEPKHECLMLHYVTHKCINLNNTYFRTTIEEFDDQKITFRRGFKTKDDVANLKNKTFTGFTVKWQCNNCEGKMIKDASLSFAGKYDFETKLFINIANLVHYANVVLGISMDEVWKSLILAKISGYEFIQSTFPLNVYKYCVGKDKCYIYKTIFQTLQLKNITAEDLDMELREDIKKKTV